MKNTYCLFCIVLLLLASCKGVKDAPIPITQIVGMYDLKNDETLLLNIDFSYEHSYNDNGVQHNEFGKWRFQRIIGLNEIIIYDMSVLSNTTYRKQEKNYFYAIKIWNKIKLSKNYEGDPDGAPALKRFNKIEI